MPKFLEARLRQQATAEGLSGDKADHYVYGAMNNLGAMHGSKETAKGRRMERQHDRDTSAAKKQTGGHPTRMAGSHDGMHITEHHRKGKKR